MDKDYVIEALTEEVERLKVQLAAQSLGETDAAIAEKIFKEQQDEIAVLSVELAAIRKSRDEFQKENHRLKSRLMYLQKQLKG